MSANDTTTADIEGANGSNGDSASKTPAAVNRGSGAAASQDTGIAEQVRAELESRAAADTEAVSRKERFFKAVPGGYGEGDRFLATSVPQQRRVAKAYRHRASLSDVEALLESPFHEVRATGLFIMVHMFEAAGNLPHPPGCIKLD